jgi:hypothetical protein
VDAWPGSVSNSFPSLVNIALYGAGQSADDWRRTRRTRYVPDLKGYPPYAFQVVRGGGREASFQHIHAHLGQCSSYF